MNYQTSRWKLVLPLFRQPFLGQSSVLCEVVKTVLRGILVHS